MAETFDRFLQIRAPSRLLDMLDTAAAARMVDRSDYVRSVLAAALRADGIGSGWGQPWGGTLNDPHIAKAEH